MSEEKFFYAKSGYAPYGDGSGFQVTTTVEKETEESEPTISIDAVFRLSASEWVKVARKIEPMLDLVTRPTVGDVGKLPGRPSTVNRESEA